MEKNFEITWSGLWRLAGMLALAGVFYYAFDIWLAVLLAIVISSGLDGIVSSLERKHIPRIVGTLVIFSVLLIVVALVLYAIIPLAISELSILLKNVDKLAPSALVFKEATEAISALNESVGKLTNILLSGNFSFADVLSNFIGGLTLAISVFILSFYLTVDRDGVEKFLIEVMPTGYEEKVLNVYYRTRHKIGWWLYGQLFLSLSVGVAVFIGLWFIGVKYGLLLAFLAGLLEIIPFAGPIVSGAAAILIASSDSLSAAIYVFILFFVVHEAESNFLVPVVTKYTTSLNPAAVLISLLVGAKLFGFIGVILAVPLAVMIQELMETWSTEKTRRKATALV